jgi:hypothetical protein
MERIIMTGVMILAFAGGALANSGNTNNSHDDQRRETVTITDHAKHCSKDMRANADVADKKKEEKKGDKSEDKKENNK